LSRIVRESEVPSESIAGLGLTGQMHGAVFLDSADHVLRPAMLWNDGRTAAQCAEITERVGEERLLQIAGNPALTGFQAPKVLWLREHEKDFYRRLARVLLPKDYIRYRLTGELATDVSDAAGTLLLDLASRDWSDEILQALEIPRAWLPRVFEGPQVTGRLIDELAADLRVPRGLPVVAGGGDNAAAAVGNGVIREGSITSSIGTSGVLFAHSDAVRLDPQGRLHTFCHAVPGAYHLMAVTLAAGGSLRWLRDTLSGSNGETLDYDSLVGEAAQVPPGSEGLLFLPYLSGERTPHRDPLARGAFVGLTARHGRGHMVRAVMEGVTFSLRDGLEIMRGMGLDVSEVRVTGGGARSELWRQMQADVFAAPITRMRAEEGPAFGAALLAGVGAGVYPDVAAAVEAAVATAGTVEPNPEATKAYDQAYEVYRTLYGALKPAFDKLAGEGA
ncbi:MAG TPA: xylulokinase, partial [Herpetosiphonaceae bacterium]|nr:xylulokinase [Herpetosiphonaceae bacterium]